MSPYEILGIRSTATLDEAEAAYRSRLLEWHTDLHAHEGPDAYGRAEHRTRQLNDAIRTVRAQRRNGPGVPWLGGRASEPALRCSMCGVQIHAHKEYRSHVLFDHAWAASQRHSQRPVVRLSLIPAPMFWALVVVMLYWGVVFSIFGDSSAAMAGWWIGVAAYLAFLPLAYRAERERRRF
jgi:uncharacterized C2H2 Zn-finger protein